MSYKIAVASSDGTMIDQTFGEAERFLIYEVEDGVYKAAPERVYRGDDGNGSPAGAGSEYGESVCGDAGAGGCGVSVGGCGAGGGACGPQSGCGGGAEASGKVELISDCRCVVCRKIGFHIQKQLERRAISAFDVSCSVEEALEKISFYFKRVDNHESLRSKK